MKTFKLSFKFGVLFALLLLLAAVPSSDASIRSSRIRRSSSRSTEKMKFEPPSGQVLYSGPLPPNHAFIYSLGKDSSQELFYSWKYKWSITSSQPVDVLVYGYGDVDDDLALTFTKDAVTGAYIATDPADLPQYNSVAFKPGHAYCLNTTACASAAANATIGTPNKLIFMFDNTAIQSPASPSPTITLVFESSYHFKSELVLAIVFGCLGGFASCVFVCFCCCRSSKPNRTRPNRASTAADVEAAEVELDPMASEPKQVDLPASTSAPAYTSQAQAQAQGVEVEGAALPSYESVVQIQVQPASQQPAQAFVSVSVAVQPRPQPEAQSESDSESEAESEAPPAYGESVGEGEVDAGLLSAEDLEKFRRLAAAKLVSGQTE